VWLAVGALATGAYFLLPMGGVAQSVVYDAIGLVSGAVILVAVRLHRPARPGVWYLFAAGQIVWVVGDVLYSYIRFALHEEPYPSVADVFYLCAYPLLIAGFLRLVRGRAARDVAGLVDACVIGTGVGLVLWVFVIVPIAGDASLPMLERAISVAYPAADAVMLAMLARLWTTPGARTGSFRLLLAAGALLLVADIGFSVLSSSSTYQDGLLDAGWMLSYVAWAGAALHPSMRTLAEQQVAGDTGRVTRGRLLLLTASSLLAPVVLFVQGATGSRAIDWLPIGLAAVVLFALVVVRMSGFVRRVQEQADQLNALAMADDLTGLPNRRRFEDRLRAARGGPVQVALVDLDDFKAVNDRLGHTVGDQLLQAVGRRLASLLRPADTVARLGGDEFAILLPDTSTAAADELVGQIAVALSQPVRAGEHQLLVAASVGVVDAAGHDPVEVMRRADVAMYSAKASGAKQRRYEPGMDERASEEARIGAQLRIGLNEGHFHLVYQPIVALPHGRVVAVEALARWRPPFTGLVGPDDFIPVAERNGLIVELGAWILRTACAQAAAWRAELGAEAPEKVSVNVSARQLAEPGFADLVARVLGETGLPASCLAIEVTETAVFHGGPALDALEVVHRLGVSIALDDFGTGHSSLRLLQTVPVDILKVDKSFVDDVTHAGRNAVIARALIDISDGLNLTAVAEGVETAEQAAELYRLGYRYVQGYHFGRPLARPDFTQDSDAAASLSRV
jgi:diguanylate cyclase